jgi:mannose-1-phosphate guanylyltransferase/mannose-6-phosphate isomerase
MTDIPTDKEFKLDSAATRWGSWQELINSKNRIDYDEQHLRVKILRLKPLGYISLQQHIRRREYLNYVSGEGYAIVSEEPNNYKSIRFWRIPTDTRMLFVAPGDIHKIVNTSKKDDLVFVEVQVGEACLEEDIVRLEDINE